MTKGPVGPLGSVLHITFNYPPLTNVSALQNRFLVQNLRRIGWDVEVLTIGEDDAEREFGAVDRSILSPEEARKVHRAGYVNRRNALIRFRDSLKERVFPKGGGDRGAMRERGVGGEMQAPLASRSVFGSVKDFVTDELLSYPDRECGWIAGGVRLGAEVVREKGCRLIYATSPPHSTLVVGHRLARAFGIPFVVDYRDPWAGNPYREPRSRLFDLLSNRLERKILRDADHVRASTGRIVNHLLALEPSCAGKISVGTSGFPEFVRIDGDVLAPRAASANKPFTIVHAGTLYGNRTPRNFLLALRRLLEEGAIPKDAVRVKFFGALSVPDREFRDLVKDGILAPIVETGTLSREACLREMARADLLVALQQGTLLQVPAKIYEYLSIGRPMLTIADEGGATWNLLRDEGFGEVVQDDEMKISDALVRSFASRNDSAPRGHYPNAERYSHPFIAEKLGRIFSDLTGKG